MDRRLYLVSVVVISCARLALVMTSPAAVLSRHRLGEARCGDHWTQLYDDMCWVKVPESHMRSADMADRFCQSVNAQLVLIDSVALCFTTGPRQDKKRRFSSKERAYRKRVMGNNGM
ncbi:uncharacterized protein LOC143294098 isoform X2 [Babylonia areolata]|uniref:uncharacterized protein LOC143294098 isoform X2 n=1 Tax=Babylonia areolata TaxID=304850 RepID=UPI003FD62AC6